MALLLDTHTLYWLMFEKEKLSEPARQLLDNPPMPVFISVVSLWEFSIKAGLGKLKLPEDFFLHFDPESKGAALLPVTFNHLETYRALPLHHRDPFDRMLVAQAISEGLTIVSSDPDFKKYQVALMEL